MRAFRCTIARFVSVIAVAGLSGCSSIESIVPSLAFSGGGAAQCDSTVPACMQQRVVTLRAMTSDRQHTWVRQSEPPHGYANGTRLFAYRITRSRMSCDNLAHGVRELRQVRASYTGAVAGVSPAELKRTKNLIVDVSGELSSEWRRRCRTASGLRGAAALT